MFNFSSLNAVFVRLRKSDSNMFLHIFTISWFVSLHKVQVLNHWYQGHTLWVFASRKIETTPFNHFQPMAPEPFCGSWNVPLHLQFYSPDTNQKRPQARKVTLSSCHQKSSNMINDIMIWYYINTRTQNVSFNKIYDICVKAEGVSCWVYFVATKLCNLSFQWISSFATQ